MVAAQVIPSGRMARQSVQSAGIGLAISRSKEQYLGIGISTRNIHVKVIVGSN
jgi:hypothetical protein